MFTKTIFAICALAAPAIAVAQPQLVAFDRHDRAAVVDHLISDLKQNGHGTKSGLMMDELKANRYTYLAIGSRPAFAWAITHDLRTVTHDNDITVRVDDNGGSGLDLGSGLYAVLDTAGAAKASTAG
jgi:hypothetical protein